MNPEHTKKLEELLKEPFKDVDQDNRWMNVNDLANFLEQHSSQLEDAKIEAIIKTFLTGLNDRSSQVQEISTKSLSRSVNSLTEPMLLQIVKTITEYMLGSEGKKDSMKMLDVYSVCLRTLINNAQDQLGHKLTSAVLQCTAGVWGSKGSPEVHEHMIDVMGTVLNRFGKVVEEFCGTSFNPLVFSKFLMQYVGQGGPTLRKKAATTFGYLGSFLSQEELLEALKSLFTNYKSASLKDKSIFVLAIHSVLENLQSKREKLFSLLPVFLDEFLSDLSHYEQNQEKEEYFDNLDSTCEIICLLLGSVEFLAHGISKRDLSTYHSATMKIATLGIKYFSYNPNQPEFLEFEIPPSEIEDSPKKGEEEEDEEEEEEMDDIELDASRKVRRCACKLLSTAISVNYPLMNDIQVPLLEVLSKLIQYPDDLVQLQVCALLKNVIQSTWYDKVENENEILQFGRNQSAEMSLNRARSQIEFSLNDFKVLIDVGMRVIHHKTTPSSVRLGICSVLTCFAKNDSSIVDDVVGAYDRLLINQMRGSGVPAEETAEILRLFQATLSNWAAFAKLEKLVVKLSEIITDFLKKDLQFTIVIEAARLCRVILKTLAQDKSKGKLPATKLTEKLVGFIVEERERDLKNAFIRSAGVLLSKWKDLMIEKPDLLVKVLQILQTRVEDDGTCGNALVSIEACGLEAKELENLPAVQKAGQSLLINLSYLLSKKLNVIRERAFSAFSKMYSVFGPRLATEDCQVLVAGALDRISFDEEYVVEQTLIFLEKFIKEHKLETLTLKKTNEALFSLVSKHQNLSNAVMIAVEKVLQTACQSTAELKELVKKSSEEINMSNFEQLSRLNGFITHLQGPKATGERASQLISKIEKTQNLKENAQLLAEIQELGELGRNIDFAKEGNVQKVLLKLFESPEDKVKRQAFMAFGTLTLGNMGFFLPKLLAMFDKYPSAQFIILHVLSEVIGGAKSEHFSIIEPTFTWIIEKSDKKELVGPLAQCLGALISLFSHAKSALFASLQKNIELKLQDSEKIQVRVLVTKSIRISIDRKAHLEDLMPIVISLLPDLEKGEPEVRAEIYHAFRDLITSGIEISLELEQEMKEAIQKCQENLKVNPKFIHEVNLGLIKHSEDRGKDMRYYLLIFLEAALGQQSLYSQVLLILRSIIQHSLVDPYESIRDQALDVLNKSMRLSDIGNELLPHLELLVDTLEKKIMEVCNVKAASRQEHQLHLLKFAAKLYYEINRNPVLSANSRFKQSINLLERDPQYADFESALLSWKI